MAVKPVGIKVELKFNKGWQKMAAALDPRLFQQNLESNLRAATRFNGLMFRAEIRRRIKSRRYTANTPFTILVKKSSTPLIDDGDLFGAVTSQDLNAYSVFIGVLRTASDSSGRSMTNIAELLHNGGTIKVTESMRNMFVMLWQVGQGKRDIGTLEGRARELADALGPRIKNVKPLRDSTKTLFIPPRPFLADVFKDPKMIKKAQTNWQKGVNAAFKTQTAAKKTSSSSSSVAGKAPPPGAGKKAKSRKTRNRSEAARKGWKTRKAKAAKGA